MHARSTEGRLTRLLGCLCLCVCVRRTDTHTRTHTHVGCGCLTNDGCCCLCTCCVCVQVWQRVIGSALLASMLVNVGTVLSVSALSTGATASFVGAAFFGLQVGMTDMRHGSLVVWLTQRVVCSCSACTDKLLVVCFLWLANGDACES